MLRQRRRFRRRHVASRAVLGVLLAVVIALIFASRLAGAQTPPALQPGRIEVDGAQRTYLIHLPGAYQPGTPVPLVLVLHGLGGSGAIVARQTGFAEEAERGGFIAVFPDGRPLAAAGNARGWALTAENNPDLRFIAALLDALQAEYSIDPARIFVAGHSNGAFLGYRIACAMPERVAAIVAVAGGLVNACTPSAPLSLLHIHGTADSIVPFAGGPSVGGLPTPGAPESIRRWASLNGCGPEPVESALEGTTARGSRISYPDCGGGVAIELVTLSGEGHAWPRVGSGFDATAAAWRFFQAHSR